MVLSSRPESGFYLDGPFFPQPPAIPLLLPREHSSPTASRSKPFTLTSEQPKGAECGNQQNG